MEQNYLIVNDVVMLIVDEADEMLKIDFQAQIVEVFKTVPESSQLVLVSATMPKAILDITENFMKDAIKILVKEDELTLDGIRQFKTNQNEEWKIDSIIDIYSVMSVQ